MSLDFKAIAQFPISELANKLGWKLEEKQTEKGLQLVGACPIAKLGTNCFKVSPGINRFICFCAECKKEQKAGGDIIELMRRLHRIDPKDIRAAAAQVQKVFGEAPDSAGALPEEPERRSGFNPLEYVKTLDPEHEALRDLELMPETLIQFKAGYSSKGLNRGRLAVAWHDNSGTVRLFLGVALDGTIPRYMVPKGEQLPYWFNAHALEPEREVQIVPDVVAVMQAVENGAENVICPLRQIDALSLSALAAICKEKKLSVEF